MPTPAYVRDLRRYVGHDLLVLPGVSGVVARPLRGSPEILLVRRADTGEWTLPSGIVEPGEQPADGLAREIWEETRIEVQVDRLALLSTDPVRYPNGDRCTFVSMTFRCHYLAGKAEVGDEESQEVRWFGLDALPELSERMARRLRLALPVRGETVFDRAP